MAKFICFRSSPSSAILFLFPFVLTLLVRAMLIGGPPFTDEGFFIFHANHAATGSFANPLAPLNLYAGTLGRLGLTTLLQLRMVDAIVAAVCAGAFFLLLRRFVYSWVAMVMSCTWVVVANNPIFIDAGFKNPIFTGWVFYLGGLLALTSRRSAMHVLAGFLLPMAAFTREPLAVLWVVGLGAAVMLHGWRGVLRFFGGSMVAGVLLLVFVLWQHGSLGVFLSYYREFSSHHSQLEIQNSNMFFQGFRRAATVLLPLIVAAVVACAGLVVFRPRSWHGVVLAGLMLIVPIIAVLLRPAPLPYSFAAVHLGMIFLIALALDRIAFGLRVKVKRWRWRLAPQWGLAAGVCVFILVVAGVWSPIRNSYKYRLALTRVYAPVMLWGQRDDAIVDRSFYLSAAGAVRSHTQPDEAVLVSGYYLILYSLADRWPGNTVFDLTFAERSKYFDNRPEWINQLRENPPAVVVETLRFDVGLDQLFPDFSSQYEMVEELPINADQHYGAFGARIWRLRQTAE